MTAHDPAVLIPAIERAADQHDTAAEPRLVWLLDDNDPAVRFYAIGALQRLTGQTLEYKSYDTQANRDAAVERWKAWLEAHGAKPLAPRRRASSRPSATEPATRPAPSP